VDVRRERLRHNLVCVRERIGAAARAAGRDPAGLTLVAVSKTWPAADVGRLYDLGVTDFAENREQEARPKTALVGSGPVRARAAAARAPVWHFVGQLQRNKARAVAAWADWVQSVDRPQLVAALSRAAVSRGRIIMVCVQVSLDAPVGLAGEWPEGAGYGRGGARPDDIPALADLVARAEGLRLAGVMAVAPRGQPARPAFARLRTVAEALWLDHPEARVVSAGMSGDLEDAVAEGATHLRIGTALFGERRGVP
jgi:pyridoxal phosphate enzyme (YggS family)